MPEYKVGTVEDLLIFSQYGEKPCRISAAVGTIIVTGW
jgi:hypothetical protein